MVRFDENDVPNKYGFTDKQNAIWELMEDGKSLDEADFKVTEEDREYYRECKWESDLINEGNTGRRKRVIRFFNE